MNSKNYEVYYDETRIGILYIRGGMHKFEADKEAIAEVSKTANLISEVRGDRDWGKPITFFDQMIKNCTRLGLKIEYHNNNYSLR